MDGRRSVAVLAILSVLVGAALSEARSLSKGKRHIRLTLAGAPLDRMEICGRPRIAALARQNERIRASIRFADASRLKRGRTRGRLLSERCEDGRWRRISSQPFGTRRSYRRVLRHRLSVDTAHVGDYRLRVVVGKVRSPLTYLRVRGAKSVDLPVKTSVTTSIEVFGPGANATYSPLFPVSPYHYHYFTGMVGSAQSECLRSRAIKVYRTDSGGSTLVGEGISQSDGRYYAGARGGDPPDGDYYVRVPKRDICGEATSDVVNSPRDVKRHDAGTPYGPQG